MSHSTASGTAQQSTPPPTPPPFNWTQVYRGVDLAAMHWNTALDPAAQGQQRQQDVNVARINLRERGIYFYTTPSSAPPTGPAFQTIGTVCTEFLKQHQLLMLAINANFSWYEGSDACGQPFSLFGLAISAGVVVSDPSQPAPQPAQTPPVSPGPNVPDPNYTGAVALLITRDNRASIQTVTAENPIDLKPYETAIAGSVNPPGGWPPQMPATPTNPQQVLVDGDNQGIPQESPIEGIAARTAVGLSSDCNTLYLLTIDGVEGPYDYGADFYDLGAWLQIAGAYNGFALDGGGSTVMARRDPHTGEPVLVNQPHGTENSSDVVERAVGNFFGVIADWNTPD